MDRNVGPVPPLPRVGPSPVRHRRARCKPAPITPVLIAIVATVVVVVGAVTLRAVSTAPRRAAAHERSRAALRRAEDRLDELSAEMAQVDAAATNTRRAVRQQALDREARRAKRTHKFNEVRFSLTDRLVRRDEPQQEG